MKLSVMLPWEIMNFLTPSLTPSRISLSSKSPGRTWRIGEVLTRFLTSDLDEIFSNASLGCYEQLDTISNSIKNIHVLIDSRKIHGGWRKSEFLMVDNGLTFSNVFSFYFLKPILSLIHISEPTRPY